MVGGISAGDVQNVVTFVAGGGVLSFIRWLVTRHADAVTEFRKALDRGLRRENAMATLCEMQLLLIDGIEEPTPQMLELRERSVAVLDEAKREIYGGSK